MLPDLEGFEAFVTSSVDRANGAASRIAQSTSTAVTALQFEDILSQLISSMARRAARIGEVSEGDQEGAAHSEPVLLPREPSVAAADARPTDPVQQHNMNPGEVELF